MPAFRGKNLRSGDISEQLGILLLQYITLVAPVPRTEDVGIDLVATLLRDFDQFRYIAEDSFFIQIKSESVKKIKFCNDQVKWLKELELPFFIASIDKKNISISLYSTYHLNDVLVSNPERTEIIFEIDESVSQYDCSDESAIIKIPLGPKIVSWSMSSLIGNEDIRSDIYTIIKSHVNLMKVGIETRRVGIINQVFWEANQEPKVFSTKMVSKHDYSNKEDIITPYFNALLQDILLEKDLLLSRSLYRLLQKTLEKQGHIVEVDGVKDLIPWQENIELE